MKLHLIGSETKTICGKGLGEVTVVSRITHTGKMGTMCKVCIKYAKEFQKKLPKNCT